MYAGDYLQHSFWKDYQANIAPFNDLLFEYGLDSIPSIVVEGDAEYRWGNQWHALFEGTNATILDPSDRTLWNDIEIMGLTMMDSKEESLRTFQSKAFFHFGRTQSKLRIGKSRCRFVFGWSHSWWTGGASYPWTPYYIF